AKEARMKAFAAIPLALLAGLQALIAWYWTHTTAAEQLKSVFTSMYGSVPAWSELAFSIGAGWLAAPIVIAAFLVASIFAAGLRADLGVASFAAFFITILMVYAVYPVHLMLTIKA